MSRPIKFRAWHKKWKTFISAEDYFIRHDGAIMEYPNSDGDGVVEWEEASEHVHIVLFTGLKDKNDVEIYEGDIVTAGLPAKVVFVDGAFTLRREGMPEGALLSDIQKEYPCEVIGNIYENPELLK